MLGETVKDRTHLTKVTRGERVSHGEQVLHGELVSQSSGPDFADLADAGLLLDTGVPALGWVWSESHGESS